MNIVRRGVEAYLRGDFDEALAKFDPEAIYKPAEEAAVQGPEAIADAWRRWAEDWEDLETIPGEFVDAGDRVLASIDIRGRGAGSGIEVQGRYYEVLTLRNGTVVHWEEFSDRSTALEAAGLVDDKTG